MRKNTIRTLIGAFLVLPLGVSLLGAGCPFFPPVDPGPKPPGDSGVTGKFVGAERCAQCHNNRHSDWSSTLHAKALEVLENIGQGDNPDCLKCHSVGFGQDGGFVDRATTNALAGVQCESCHGAARDHVENVAEASLRPKIDLSASVCGQCHTGEHQPNFDDWLTSKHANSIEPSHLTAWAAGTAGNLTNCGKCHSGDFFYHKIIKGETVDSNGVPVDDNYLKGKTSDQMLRITCAICHNPHAKTGNAADPEEGRDYQLRFPEVKYTTPTTDLTAAQDPTRFNICGQCHHTRDRTWVDSSREPHPSDQTNVFFGELPSPPAFPDPIVPSRPSVHLNAPKQCATCHVARKLPEGGIAPSVSGHTFEVNFLGCVQCHGTVDIAQAKLNGLKSEFDYRLNLVLAALDAWAARNTTFCTSIPHTGACWEYTSQGGPANNAGGQGKIPNDIKKARYIYFYMKEGGGDGGVHNPDFTREALMMAKQYADNAPNVP